MNKKTIIFTAAAAATATAIAKNTSRVAGDKAKAKVNESVKPAKKAAKSTISKTADFARNATTHKVATKLLNPELIDSALNGIAVAEDSSKNWVKKTAKKVHKSTERK